MMKLLQKAPRIGWLALALVISLSSCKSHKKALDAQKAAEKAKMEQEEARRKQEAEQKARDAQEQARRDEEARKKAEEKASTPYSKLGSYFDAIANSANATSANNSINEALSMFASPETPVLIVISGSGDQKDYDRPTTIRAYLNYLKDQKKNVNKIENLQLDASGKITEVELRK
jgi:predicted acyl esterase